MSALATMPTDVGLTAYELQQLEELEREVDRAALSVDGTTLLDSVRRLSDRLEYRPLSSRDFWWAAAAVVLAGTVGAAFVLPFAASASASGSMPLVVASVVTVLPTLVAFVFSARFGARRAR